MRPAASRTVPAKDETTKTTTEETTSETESTEETSSDSGLDLSANSSTAETDEQGINFEKASEILESEETDEDEEETTSLFSQ